MGRAARAALRGGPALTRKLRVLTLIDALFSAGGAERLAAQITLGLDPRRFDRFVVSTRQWGKPAFVDELREAGVELLFLERSSKWDLLAWRPLVELLRRERIDVVHAHKFGGNVWGTVFGRLTGVPVIVAHEHTWPFVGEPLRQLLDRELVSRFASVLLAVSQLDRERMTSVERIPPERTRFLPNGIPPPKPLSGRDVRAELGIAPDAPVVASVSVLRRQKALEVLVEAARLLAPEVPGVRVLIAGVGPEEERLRAQIARGGLEQTVLLIGRRDDVPDVLAASDVAVQCSDWEGSPLAVMEYMAAGRAVVATRVGGVPDLIEHGVHGLLVEPQDPPALAAALAELLRDPERRARMGEAGRERQRAEFDLGVMVRRVEELYEELYARTARARREGWRPLPR